MSRRTWLGHAGALALCCALPVAGAAPATPSAPVAADLARPTPIASGVWALWGHEGDADALNRGHVVNLLLAVESDAVWIIGSGPSPAFGRSLDRVRRRMWPGRSVELISPWAHPESVLGAAGLEHRHHWAHADVAAQMASRCAGCLQRLLQRLGASAHDFPAGDEALHAIRLPDRHLQGASGRLGPFDWWACSRADDVTVTAWRHRRSGILFAPGLLWGDLPPDGRDADTVQLARSTDELLRHPLARAPAVWVGQQGRTGTHAMARQAVAYWSALHRAIDEAQEAGEDGIMPVRHLQGCPPGWLQHPHHDLNWQRAWRQAESRWLQRSLR